MKIEMGESLFYSWLRHVKECQIVQTNWKTSQQWQLLHENELEYIMEKTDEMFQSRYGYKIYKKTSSLSQLLKQAECDTLGINIQEHKIYAVDVAFHEAGLNYGNRKSTVMKILTKCLRTAMCIYGYLDSKEAEVIFASPKISKLCLADLEPCLKDMQMLMDAEGFKFSFRIIGNADFGTKVLDPIMEVSAGVSDTTELFMRSYQMLQLFDSKGVDIDMTSSYEEIKVGQLVRVVMRRILENGKVSDEELSLLQDKAYGRTTLGISYPLLVKTTDDYDSMRYYKDPVHIKDTKYVLCSQWAESAKPYLIKWIKEHE